MRILVTGAAALHWLPHGRTSPHRPGHGWSGSRQPRPYYDVRLKEARLKGLARRDGFRFIKAELGDRTAVEATFAAEKPKRVCISPPRQGPLLARPPARLYQFKRHRLPASSKGAAITGSSISSMPRRARSMAEIARFHSGSATMSTIRSASMARPRRRTS